MLRQTTMAVWRAGETVRPWSEAVRAGPIAAGSRGGESAEGDIAKKGVKRRQHRALDTVMPGIAAQ